MKRALSLTLALCLVMGLGLTALAGGSLQPSGEDKAAQLAELVQAYIVQEGYNSYEYNEEDAYYEGTHTLESALGSCTVYVDIYDDMVAVQATPSLRVPEAYRDNMAIFLTLANNREYYSSFLLKFDSGEIYSRSAQLVEEIIPGLKEIDVLHYMPILTLDDYGNGIARVAGGADPRTTFEETVAEIEAE